MKNIDYDNIGNIPKDYTFIPHQGFKLLGNDGLIKTPALVLKVYGLCNKVWLTHPTPKTRTKLGGFLMNGFEACDFIKNEIEKREITPLLGLGFAIFSGDYLNVGRWDNKFPHVLQNLLYSYGVIQGRKRKKGFTTLDIRKDGAFCTEEFIIASYESEAWRRFLQSKQDDKAKKRYLEDFMPDPRETRLRIHALVY